MSLGQAQGGDSTRAGPDLSRESSRFETAQRDSAGGAVGGCSFVVYGRANNDQPSTINHPDPPQEEPEPLMGDPAYREGL